MTTVTDFDICKSIQKRFLTISASVAIYGWEDEFCASQLREMPSKTKETDGYSDVNPNNLTADEMDQLGFGLWDEESKFRLIPVWLYPFLCGKWVGGSVSSSEVMEVHLSDVDTDHRFGCLAYGAIPKDSGDLPSD